jgi:hypothetical protein
MVDFQGKNDPLLVVFQIKNRIFLVKLQTKMSFSWNLDNLFAFFRLCYALSILALSSLNLAIV